MWSFLPLPLIKSRLKRQAISQDCVVTYGGQFGSQEDTNQYDALSLSGFVALYPALWAYRFPSNSPGDLTRVRTSPSGATVGMRPSNDETIYVVFLSCIHLGGGTPLSEHEVKKSVIFGLIAFVLPITITSRWEGLALLGIAKKSFSSMSTIT